MAISVLWTGTPTISFGTLPGTAILNKSVSFIGDGGAPPNWWLTPDNLLDGQIAVFVADIGRQRFMLFGAPCAATDILSISSDAKLVTAPDGTFAEVPANTLAFVYGTLTGFWYLLLEGASTNLCTRSDNLVDAAWTATGAVVSYYGPNGQLSFWRLAEALTSSGHQLAGPNGVVSAGSSYVYSVVAKYESKQYLQLLFSSVAFNFSNYCTFDLVNGTVAYTGAGCSAYITRRPDGSYLCEIVATAVTTAATRAGINILVNNPATRAQSYLGSGQSVLLCAPQLEAGTRATSPIKTLGSAVTRATDVCQLTPAAAAALQGAAGSAVWQGTVMSAVALQQLLGISGGNSLLRGGSTAANLLLVGSSAGGLTFPGVLPGELGVALGFDGSGRYAAKNGGATVSDANTMDQSRAELFLGSSTGLPTGAVQNVAKVAAWNLRGTDAALDAKGVLYS